MFLQSNNTEKVNEEVKRLYTLTNNTNILIMATIIDTPVSIYTIIYDTFITLACHII